jgi:ADP-ribose pyrophosphatase YjhB (NUDIX family)
MRRRRLAARTIVLAPDFSTFLLRYDDVEVGRHWAMPGGGLEPGESFEQAASRELSEETGWTDVAAERLLCTWEHNFTRFGEEITQYEQIFIAAGPVRDPHGDLTESHQSDEILEWRWWSLTQITATDELMWPPNLSELLTRYRQDPATPVMHLGSRYTA